jgi:hypothetical protein
MSYYYNFEAESIFVPAAKVPEMINALVPLAQEAIAKDRAYRMKRMREDADNPRYDDNYHASCREKLVLAQKELDELPARVFSRYETLENLQWSFIFDEEGNLTDISHGESKSTDMEELETIASFMPDGGYVEVQGEDRGDLYRFVFRGGKMKHVQAVISFPESQESKEQ